MTTVSLCLPAGLMLDTKPKCCFVLIVTGRAEGERSGCSCFGFSAGLLALSLCNEALARGPADLLGPLDHSHTVLLQALKCSGDKLNFVCDAQQQQQNKPNKAEPNSCVSSGGLSADSSDLRGKTVSCFRLLHLWAFQRQISGNSAK